MIQFQDTYIYKNKINKQYKKKREMKRIKNNKMRIKNSVSIQILTNKRLLTELNKKMFNLKMKNIDYKIKTRKDIKK